MLVFRNETHATDNAEFLAVRLEGPPGNPTCVGARVTVTDVSGASQTAEVYAGSGYLTQSVSTLYFGRTGVTLREIHVRWPDGRESVQQLEPDDRRLILYPPG